MKKFKIEVISKRPKKIWGLKSYRGKIIIDNFEEEFIIPVNIWNINEYVKQ